VEFGPAASYALRGEQRLKSSDGRRRITDVGKGGMRVEFGPAASMRCEYSLTI
jgi:hypothetical protein